MVNKDDIKVDDESQLLFWIPDENMAMLKDKLAKLSKKLEKAGYPAIFCMPIGFKDERGPGNYVHRIWEVLISGITPKIEGWEFWARIDYHRSSGNVIYAAPGKSIPEKYYSIDSVCEHCNMNRKRKTGYLLHHTETGEFKVVGSTCISEFFNAVTPESVAKYFETIRKSISYAKGCSKLSDTIISYGSIVVEEFVSATIEAINLWGWYSSTQAKETGNYSQSTAAKAQAIYNGRDNSSPVPHLDESIKIVNWAKNLSDDEIVGNNFLNNIRVIARDGVARISDENMIAGMVRAYQNKFNPHDSKILDLTKSVHVGKLGDKVEMGVTVISSFFSVNGGFEVVKLLDSQGNVFTWFNHGKTRSKKDDTLKIKGTVKAHNEYKGVKETILTRVKIV